MLQLNFRGAFGALPFVCLSALLCTTTISCGEAEPEPAYVEPDLGGEQRDVELVLTVDSAHADLQGRDTLEPIATPVRVEGGDASLGGKGFVRRIASRPGLLWVELFLENHESLAWGDVELEVLDSQGTTVLDLTNDPYAEEALSGKLTVGNLGAEGLGRVVFGLPDDGASHRLSLRVRGTTTSREAHSSAPLSITPDGAEVWAVVPDADVVAVVETASQTRAASLDVGDHPRSVALTPDGAFAAVVSSDSNELHIFDTATREVVASFGESDGLGRDPRHVVAAPDGSRFYVSAFVGDRVSEFVRTASGFRAGRSVEVGRRPLGLGVSLDGQALVVAHYLPRGRVTENEGWLSVIDTESFEFEGEAVAHDDFNLDRVECMTKVFPVSPSRLTSEGVPTQLAGVFYPPSGNQAWVPGTQVGPTAVWETGPDAQELGVTAVLRPAEFLAPFTYLFDSRNALATTPMVHPGVLEAPDVNYDYISCARPLLSIESLPRDLLSVDDNLFINRGVATPSALTGTDATGIARFVGFSRGGRRALTLSYLSDELIVTDAMTFHGDAQGHVPLSGANPTGVVASPDGSKLYVSYDNSVFLSVLDASSLAVPEALPGPHYLRYEYADVEEFPSPPTPVTNLRLVRHIDELPELPAIEEVGTVDLVDQDPMDPVLRRGKILFSSSNPDKYDVSASKLGTCGSCHPDGTTDGSVWGTMEGERRTMSLAGGVAGRGWLHASGTHRDAAEFVEIIVRERLFGDLSDEDYAAMAEFVAFGIPKLQAPVTDASLVAKGEELFQANCATCHFGDRLTSAMPDSEDPLGGGLESGPAIFDVGTQTDSANALLGTFFEALLPADDAALLDAIRGDRELGTSDWVQEALDFRPRPDRAAGHFKAPTLTNVWHNVIFFHDGRYDNLDDVVQHFNQEFGLGLSADDREAIVEYLKTL